MPILRASDLVNQIGLLGKNITMEYFSGKAYLKIFDVTEPDGPITVLRWKRSKRSNTAKKANISIQQLFAAASIFSANPDFPINLDRSLSGSGNTRAALETLLAHTPNFFICYPRRANPYTGKIDRKLKHIIWSPAQDHIIGKTQAIEYEGVISIVELVGNTSPITIPAEMKNDESSNEEAKRTHIEMQASLARIGAAAGFHIWIARNDRSALIGARQLAQMEGVIASIDEIPLFYTANARKAAANIDCIWFSDDYRSIPAIFEVEHSTGVTSGLTRMQKLKDVMPDISTKYTIVASNDMRMKVVNEANNPTFKSLATNFMPYSAVRELDGIIRRYPFSKSIGSHFFEPFIESVA